MLRVVEDLLEGRLVFEAVVSELLGERLGQSRQVADFGSRHHRRHEREQLRPESGGSSFLAIASVIQV